VTNAIKSTPNNFYSLHCFKADYRQSSTKVLSVCGTVFLVSLILADSNSPQRPARNYQWWKLPTRRHRSVD